MKAVLALTVLFCAAHACPGMGPGSGTDRGGMFFEPFLKVSPLKGETGLWLGGRGGWSLGHGLGAGGAIAVLMSEHSYPLPDDYWPAAGLEMAYVGWLLSYVPAAHRRQGVGFGLVWGVGWTEIAADNDMVRGTPGVGERDRFAVIEPSIYGYHRFWPRAMLTAGFGTMIVSGMRGEFTGRDFARPALHLGVRFE